MTKKSYKFHFAECDLYSREGGGGLNKLSRDGALGLHADQACLFLGNSLGGGLTRGGHMER